MRWGPLIPASPFLAVALDMAIKGIFDGAIALGVVGAVVYFVFWGASVRGQRQVEDHDALQQIAKNTK